MVKRREYDASLFDRFRDVLDQLGIDIEIDREGDAVEEITRRFDDLSTKETRAWEAAHVNGFQRERRASFDSLYGTFLEENDQDVLESGQTRLREPRDVLNRPTSRTSEPYGRKRSISRLRAQVHSRERAGFRAVSDNHYQPSAQIGKSHKNGLSDDDYIAANNSVGWQLPRFRSRSLGQYVLAKNEGGTTDAPKHEMSHEVIHSWDYRPSDTQILQDAEAFQDHRIALVTRKLLCKWRDDAILLTQHHETMYKGAQAYDRNTLLRQAWDQWRAKDVERRQEVETERFFKQLSLRAGKARDLFVLTKAFTHWAQSASDEILRTSVARRHILRTKYFNAWRDITVVNELKVRRQCLNKSLAKWRHHAAIVKANEMRATAFHDDKLVQKLYWDWFWKFCNRRAPLWAAGRTRRITFNRWANLTIRLRERENWVSHETANSVQRKIISTWKLRYQNISMQNQIADNYQRHCLLLNTLNSLKRYLTLMTLLKQLVLQQTTRTRAEIFAAWRWRAKVSQQAVEVRRFALARSAWTIWNDRLRCEALCLRIDERIVADQFSRWVRASRSALLSRIQQVKTLRLTFDTWACRKREHERDMIIARQVSDDKSRARLSRLCLRRWRYALEGQRQRRSVAFSIFASRSTKRYFTIWSRQYIHVEHINRQAFDAQYYVACTHALQKWQSATEASRRWRRREAYAMIRRRVKRSVVQRVFIAWRLQNKNKISMAESATAKQEEFSTHHALSLLRLWRQNLAFNNSQVATAVDQHNKRLIISSLRSLSTKLNENQILSDRATEFRFGISVAAAAIMLRKLNWQAFQIERQNESAAALRERNQEKHYRIMLRYWAEKARSAEGGKKAPYRRKEDQFLSNPEHYNLTKSEEEDKEEAIMAKAEDWSALDTDLHLDLSLFPGAAGNTVDGATAAMAGITTSTPLPGYLRTPSKRIARTKSRFRMLDIGSRDLPFTPATAPVRRKPVDGPNPLITPFRRKLREQGYSEQRLKKRGQLRVPSTWQASKSGVRAENSTMQSGFIGDFEDLMEDEQSREFENIGNDTIA